MFRFDHTAVRMPTDFLAALGLLLIITGCAGSRYGDAEGHMDSREKLQQLSCPGDMTTACVQRIGKTTRCSCSRRDDLEALLEPQN